jgi:hypothetical protein
MRFFKQRDEHVHARSRGIDNSPEIALEHYQAILARAGVPLVSRDSVQTPADAHKVAAFAGLVTSAMAWG